jgi:hypothetical protein
LWISFAYANSNSHSHNDCKCHGHCNGNGNGNCLGNAYSYGTTVAKGYTNSAASPDCSTSAVSRN